MPHPLQRLPEGFLERFKRIYASADKLSKFFLEPKPTTFRLNTLKENRIPVLKEDLSQAGFMIERVAWFDAAFILRKGRLRDLQELSYYREGRIYVQSLASMLPARVLDPQPGEEILDMTAAPGSKTTQMAAMMRNEGRLVANDNNRVRFFKLKANLEAQGVACAELMLAYGESLGKRFPERFDRVLVDAPCSAETRFIADDPRTFGYWKIRKIEEMARKQKKLLFSAVQALKPGGVLVYSTCTFAPEENEQNIDWLLDKFSGKIETESIALEIPNRMSGLVGWEGKRFNAGVAKSLRVIPTSDMEGFFIAKLRKV